MLEVIALFIVIAIVSGILSYYTTLSGLISGSSWMLAGLVAWTDYADVGLTAMFVLLALSTWYVTLFVEVEE